MITATAATSEKLRTAGMGVSAAMPKASASAAAARVMEGPAAASASPRRSASGAPPGCRSKAWLMMNLTLCHTFRYSSRPR